MMISIIVPVYNCEKYIVKCMDSLMSQNFSMYEVIVINDGSTDLSENILKEYASKYKNIKYVSQKNKGQGYARNVGLEMISGEYVYFCDADDYIEHNTLQTCYEAITRSEDIDVVAFQGDIFGDIEGRDVNFYKPLKKLEISNGTIIGGYDFICSYYKKISMLNIPMMFIKTSFLKNNHIFFPESIIYEDFEFFWDLISNDPRILFIDDVLYHRRYRAGSTMTKASTDLNYHSYIHNYKKLMMQSADRLREPCFYKSLISLKSATGVIINNNIEISDEDIISLKKEIMAISIDEASESISQLLYLLQIYEDLEVITAESIDKGYLFQVIKRRLSGLYKELGIADADKNVGIYGIGVWARRVLKAIRYAFGEEKGNIILIDTYIETGREFFLGHEVKNIEDVEFCEIDSILVISEKKEKEIIEYLKNKEINNKIIGFFCYFSE